MGDGLENVKVPTDMEIKRQIHCNLTSDGD